jgi:5-methylcytosine-specific restriction endonuclease McrA
MMAARFPSDPRRKFSPNPRHKQRLRATLRARDGDLCCYCRQELDFASYLNHCPGTKQPLNGATLEHVVPFALGGTWDPENLKLACRGCNQALGRAIQRQRTAETKAARVFMTSWPALMEAVYA